MNIRTDKHAYSAEIVRLGQRINNDTDDLFEVVADSRLSEDPLTWEEIGILLGITRQSAWARFTQYNLTKRPGTIHPDQGSLL